jgi:hypothetical protein
MNHMAVTDIDLKRVVNDAVIAANKSFGVNNWRIYVASDAPGIKLYISKFLEPYTAGPPTYLKGAVGHNFKGGMGNTKDDKVEISINAFVDMDIMSEAAMLIYLNSKFPEVANIRSQCPQRHLRITGHPRHALAKAGMKLTKALSAGALRTAPWRPALDEGNLNEFIESLPEGRNNLCLQDSDPVRSCFCLVKLSHA